MERADARNFTCASVTCGETATVLLAGVPLCDDHQRLVAADVTLPRPKYVSGKPWFVYYVTWPHLPDIVKIGASNNPASRLNSLKRDGRLPVVLVIEPGTGDLETERHAQFADLCLSHRGEYFRYRSPLTEHVAALQREHPNWLGMLPGRLPWWLDPSVTAETWDDLPRCPGITLSGTRCRFKAGFCRHHDEPKGQS